ncbi:hypothetical protein IF1G_02629 [Cordyceps javanica]|uniref:Uncharacterized protein n=1 Tax=Cordyceps javanica TaxID=43265 RepID=A0A545VAC6_9HYPO|nr:hypothetical protein IF1G_02629 [Cordyceps javanica]
MRPVRRVRAGTCFRPAPNLPSSRPSPSLVFKNNPRPLPFHQSNRAWAGFLVFLLSYSQVAEYTPPSLALHGLYLLFALDRLIYLLAHCQVKMMKTRRRSGRKKKVPISNIANATWSSAYPPSSAISILAKVLRKFEPPYARARLVGMTQATDRHFRCPGTLSVGFLALMAVNW